MATRVFLGLMGLVFFPYGVYCFLAPGVLADAAGVASISATGHTELRAMYGGVQAALGALAALAVVRAELVRPALVAMAFVGTGLFATRITGSTLDHGWSAYTGMALAFEAVIGGGAIALLRRGAPAPAAPSASASAST